APLRRTIVYGAAHQIPQRWHDLPLVEQDRGLLSEQDLRSSRDQRSRARIDIKADDAACYLRRRRFLSARLRALEEHRPSRRHPRGELAIGNTRQIRSRHACFPSIGESYLS